MFGNVLVVPVPPSTAAEFRINKIHDFRHHSIVRLEGTQPFWRPFPVFQHFGQDVRRLRLQDIDHDDEKKDEQDGHADPDEDVPAGERQPQDRGGQDEERHEKVSEREPAVIRRRVTQDLRAADRHASHGGHRIPERDTGNVEEQMAQRDLERLLEVRGGRHGGENGSDGCTNVRSQRQRVRPFEGNHPDANERRERRGEYGTGLDEHGHASADQNGHVTSRCLKGPGKSELMIFLITFAI